MEKLGRILAESIAVLTAGFVVLVPNAAQGTLTFGGAITVSGTAVTVVGPLLAGFHDNGFGTSGQTFTPAYGAGDFDDLPLDPAAYITYSMTPSGGTSAGTSKAEFGARYDSNFVDNLTLDLNAGFTYNGLYLDQTDLDLGTANGPAVLKVTLWIPFTTDIDGTGEFINNFDVGSNFTPLGASDSVTAEMCVYVNSGDILLDASPASCTSKSGVYTSIASLATGATLPAPGLGSNISVSAFSGTLYILVATWEIVVKNDSPKELRLEDFGFGFGPPPPPVPLFPSWGLLGLLVPAVSFLVFRQTRHGRLIPGDR